MQSIFQELPELRRSGGRRSGGRRKFTAARRNSDRVAAGKGIYDIEVIRVLTQHDTVADVAAAALTPS